MKILNLYAGIGGNRKLWNSPDLEITSIEYDKGIANIYKDLYPNDNVIIGDAHEYLLNHYEEYDFIWASPPCPSHSVTNHFLNAQGVRRYPDMNLYGEIILLQTFFKGKYVIENVKPYYEPLIKAQESGRHLFWANFKIPKTKGVVIGRMDKLKDGTRGDKSENLKEIGIDLSKYKYPNKDKLLRNCVAPEIGLAIFESALNIYDANKINQIGLFAVE
jgi:DNA (cytosine-5)-methyltransferase 1